MFNFLSKKSTANTKSISLVLSGLHCTSCAVNIDFSLEDLPGIVNSKTNYAKSSTTVDFEPGKTNTKTIITEIEKLGYQAKLV